MELVRGNTLRDRLDDGPIDPWARPTSPPRWRAPSSRPRRRAGPPRHQAGQHPAVRGRPGEGRRLRHRQGRRVGRPHPGGGRSSARPSTWRPSRSRPSPSTAAPTSTAWASSSTRCCAAGCRSRPTPAEHRPGPPPLRPAAARASSRPDPRELEAITMRLLGPRPGRPLPDRHRRPRARCSAPGPTTSRGHRSAEPHRRRPAAPSPAPRRPPPPRTPSPTGPAARADPPAGTPATRFADTERRWLVPTLVVVLVAVALGVAGLLFGRSGDGIFGGDDDRPTPPETTPTEQTTATITALDRLRPRGRRRRAPRGGGGRHAFDGDPRRRGPPSRYTSPDWAGLKPGVGLILELDEAGLDQRRRVRHAPVGVAGRGLRRRARRKTASRVGVSRSARSPPATAAPTPSRSRPRAARCCSGSPSESSTGPPRHSSTATPASCADLRSAHHARSRRSHPRSRRAAGDRAALDAAPPAPRAPVAALPAARGQRPRRRGRPAGGAGRHRPGHPTASTAARRSRPGPTGWRRTRASTSCAAGGAGAPGLLGGGDVPAPVRAAPNGRRRTRWADDGHGRLGPGDEPGAAAIEAVAGGSTSTRRWPGSRTTSGWRSCSGTCATSTTPRSAASSTSLPARSDPASPAAAASSPTCWGTATPDGTSNPYAMTPDDPRPARTTLTRRRPPSADERASALVDGMLDEAEEAALGTHPTWWRGPPRWTPPAPRSRRPSRRCGRPLAGRRGGLAAYDEAGPPLARRPGQVSRTSAPTGADPAGPGLASGRPRPRCC